MTTLLHIDASINGDRSVSRAVTETFRREWEAQCPGGTVIYRDLAADPLPHLTGEAYRLGSVPLAEQTPQERATFALRDELTSELESADAVLIGAPLYNYSVSSGLKAWVDHIVITGRTSMTEAPAIEGKPVTVVTSRGGSYAPGAPMEGNDFAMPYLKWLLGGSLKMDVTFVVPELTLAPFVPAMAHLLEKSEASRDKAHEEARACAKKVASQLTGNAS